MKAFFSLAVGCLISLSAWAQETVAVNTGDIVSPEVGSALGALPHFCGRFPRACPRTVLTCLHVHGSPL